MEDIQLCVRVVARDGSVRTIEVTSGGALDVQPGDRLVLFGRDAANARLVRQGDDLALVIDGQVVFILDDYYTLEGPQAAEVITDPAVAATYLTAGEGGAPLLTTPVLETGTGAGPPGAQAAPVDLVQATSPDASGDNASAKSWSSDEDIPLDDSTYRSIAITHDDEDEFIFIAEETPPAAAPAEEALNLPPYFTTVTVDDTGRSTNAGDPVDGYDFQMCEHVAPYQLMGGIHPTGEHGDGPAGNPWYWSEGSYYPDLVFPGWGYMPNDFLGYIGVVDPEGDPITVQWRNESLADFFPDGVTPDGYYQLSEFLSDGAFTPVSLNDYWDFGGQDGLEPGDGALNLYTLVDANGDPLYENVFQVHSSLVTADGYDGPGYYEFDGPDGVAAVFGLTDQFQTQILASDSSKPGGGC